ncbi:cadherin-like beta sandwich domain-containing protein [Clostridium sp.]|uniref:cadherin-like beta sandwich domain-containing protein n=1 Tax=Clostridium sp. TaxID=1506 RepID=UPI00262EDE24|nr:cadherin-like beta sandwich domain-containing protein [Clostridium sp.]
MNNKIKCIISIAMAITIFSVVEPLNPFNLGITEAYAASYALTDLQMQDSNGNDINLYENDNYTRELDNSNGIKSTYYAKLSSDTPKVVFRTSGADGIVKIFKDRSSKVYDEGNDIPVLAGKTNFYIRIYDTYDEGKTNYCKSEYKVVIKKYTSEEEQAISNDNQDNIYLKTIQLDYGNVPLSFDKEISTYNTKVDANVNSIAIKAEPEDGATTVKINNITVDENDDYKKMVNLNDGDNKIEITLSQDDEEKRTYTVNINRGGTTTTTGSSSNSGESAAATAANGNTTSSVGVNSTQASNNDENNDVNAKIPNKWVKVGDKWRYNDGFGNPIKNTWYYDSSYGKTYYFDNDGNMLTGWLNLNNNWYYLNSNGAMETGWKQIGYNWYYLDYDGKMKTGWFKDSDGKYYYLYEASGAMAHDTIINGYKLGSNGAWVK